MRAFLGRAVVELVYKFDEKSYLRMFEMVSQSLKYDSNIILSTNIYIYIHIYGLQPRSKVNFYFQKLIFLLSLQLLNIVNIFMSKYYD